ncbi:MAG: hypothetical protein JNG84_10030 [Archangium sp.]|nr:hypothetical protein [Archangium sp.]
MRWLVAAAVFGVGCAHNSVVTAPAPTTAATAKSHPRSDGTLCRYRKLPWASWSTLSLPGTGQPFGIIYGQPRSSLLFDGVLKTARGGAVLEGQLAGPLVELSARVDAARQVLLYAKTPLRQGTWFLATPEARLQVVGGSANHLELTVEPELLQRLHPAEPIRFTASCDQVTMTRPELSMPVTGSQRQYPPAAEAMGLTSTTPEAVVLQRTGVELFEEPNGRRVATIDFSQHDRVAVAERRGGFVRLGFEVRQHLFVFGWINAQAVAADSEAPRAVGEGLGIGLGSLGEPSAPKFHVRCPVPLELSVGIAGARTPVGRVMPEAPLEVLDPSHEGFAPVRLVGVALSPRAGVALLVPESVLECPAKPAD